MRSDLVYPAVRKVPNRYLLCQVASKATRKFHRPNTRVQDTMNQILEKFGHAETEGLVSPTPALARLERQAA